MNYKDLYADTYGLFQTAFDHFNGQLFNGELPPVMITFFRQRNLKAFSIEDRWVHTMTNNHAHELSLNPEYFSQFPLVEIFQALCHELVHLWLVCQKKSARRGYHHNDFAVKMISIGLMPSATGKPGGKMTGEGIGEYIIFNGRFHLACQSLLLAGFEIKFFDRYPIYRHDLPVLTYDDNGNAISLDKLLYVKRRVWQEPAVSASGSSLSHALPIETGTRVVPIDPAHPKPSSSGGKRQTYRCPKCTLTAWGKRGLNVLCELCNEKLIESPSGEGKRRSTKS